MSHGWLEVGDFVWLNNPSKKIGLSPKLMTFWEEVPYEIIEKISEVTYRVRNLGNKKERIVHSDRLKRLNLDHSVPEELRRRLTSRAERSKEKYTMSAWSRA